MRIDLIVVARILDALYTEKKMKKTRLQLASRLNYPSFMKYLNWLIEKELVKITVDGKVEYIQLSEKGIESYEKLVKWVKEYMGKI